MKKVISNTAVESLMQLPNGTVLVLGSPKSRAGFTIPEGNLLHVAVSVAAAKEWVLKQNSSSHR